MSKLRIVVPILLVATLVAGCKDELVCPQGETDCGGRCVSLLSDAANCGACGAACGALEACSGGTCGCEPGIATCAEVCTDLARDPAHCGSCDTACGVSDPLCLTDAGATTCVATCPGGFTACSGACVNVLSDRYNCGACGNACAAGETCRDGGCRADLQVACYATSEVVPVTADLAPAGEPRTTPSGTAALAVGSGAVYAANGWPSSSVSVLPLDPALPAFARPLSGDDLQHIAVHENVVLVANSASGTFVVLDAAGTVLDEIPMPRQQDYPNPKGFAVAGTTAYVALGGNTAGQTIAKVHLSRLAACAAGTAGSAGCGDVTGEIALADAPGAASEDALPFPFGVAAAGGRVFVTLGNLGLDTIPCGAGCSFTDYVKPAGSGRLAVIDPARADALSIVDLGAACGNPGGVAVHGTTLWVACGSFGYPTLAPGALLPVDIGRTPPVPGEALAVPAIVPGKVAFCGAMGYVTDQASGAVLRFDPATRIAEEPVTVCATGEFGFAWAADIACGD